MEIRCDVEKSDKKEPYALDQAAAVAAARIKKIKNPYKKYSQRIPYYVYVLTFLPFVKRVTSFNKQNEKFDKVCSKNL